MDMDVRFLDPLPSRDGARRGDAPTSSIGEILVEAGCLDRDAAARIGAAQRENGLRFGEAALRLQLLTADDIEFALARQFGYPYVRPSERLAASRVALAARPSSAFGEQMRTLRTQVAALRALQPDAGATVALLSALPGEGRSTVAANLAVAFAQAGERTLLVDADLRRPSQHRLFGLPCRLGLSNLLLGRADLGCVERVPNLLDLSLLTAGSTPPNPQELLSRSRLSSLLNGLSAAYDVVVIDTPPASRYADAQIVAARVAMGIVVARAGRSDVHALARTAAGLRHAGANLVGTVLNDG